MLLLQLRHDLIILPVVVPDFGTGQGLATGTHGMPA